jgi:hypothetical protein
MANGLPTKPLKCLLFRSPLPKGEGVKQALAWNREQLLDLRRLWELRQQRRIDTGLIPMAQPPLMISDNALGVENKTSIAMDTVTCPWHVLLDVSRIGSVANSMEVAVLSADPKPLLT